MEMNIAAAQQAIRGIESSQSIDLNSLPPQQAAALLEAKANIERGASSLLSTTTTTTTTNTNGTPNGSTSIHDDLIGTQAERLQLIDENQKFNSEMAGYLKKWKLEEAGFNYNLCAVVGSQSTGKSTLLNKLFGTTFDVMKENERRQTTRGIWMSRAQGMPLLVLDVEGSDGRERGEDQDFERKSALFSMASAEVLMVNMWEHQVGLYQGANMGMLKTVFEVNLGLFQAAKSKGASTGKDKTLILFVIRDHIAVTPMANLSNTLTADLHRIWDSLSKPEGLESVQISDFFDFAFTSLPHKLLQPEEFDRQVIQLRSRFASRDSSSFLFQPQYHKRIPADGLPRYLDTIWEQVMTNKDLDLPTQQELLAQFRCDEIANVAFAVFVGEIKPLRKPVEGGTIIESLGTDMDRMRTTALSKFDKEASRYHAEVYKRKRVELLEKLNSALSPIFLGQLKNLHKTILANFKLSILDKLRGDNHDFGQVVSAERERAEESFTGACLLICLKDTDWTVTEEVSQFKESIDQIANQCRIEETKKMVIVIERNFKKEIAEPTELALARPNPEMWDSILESFREALQKAELTYAKKAKSFNCTEEENAAALSLLKRKAWLALRAKIDEQTADTVLMSRLRSVFEDRFRYDEEGVPRVWKPDDDIDGLFRVARDETLNLIPLYARIEPSDPSKAIVLPSTAQDPHQAALVERGEEEEFDFASTLLLFSEIRKGEIITRFRREADAYYVEAKRSTVSSIAQVPLWMYGVMIALGWNEFLAVVRSPVYFTFLLLCIAGAYVVYRLNLAGPLTSVGKAVGREMHRIADEQLRQHFSQPLPQPAILAEPVSSSSIRSEKPASTTSLSNGEIYELQEKKEN
ncbi:hypothetical protein CBS101457_004292 [Exobasidium rhododendri]|nr:hypothetical protein CBS101457_004292 [Exobasidium rhododendri]